MHKIIYMHTIYVYIYILTIQILLILCCILNTTGTSYVIANKNFSNILNVYIILPTTFGNVNVQYTCVLFY